MGNACIVPIKSDWNIDINFEKKDMKINYVLNNDQKRIKKIITDDSEASVEFSTDIVNNKMYFQGSQCGTDGDISELKNCTREMIKHLELLLDELAEVKPKEDIEEDEMVEQ